MNLEEFKKLRKTMEEFYTPLIVHHSTMLSNYNNNPTANNLDKLYNASADLLAAFLPISSLYKNVVDATKNHLKLHDHIQEQRNKGVPGIYIPKHVMDEEKEVIQMIEDDLANIKKMTLREGN